MRREQHRHLLRDRQPTPPVAEAATPRLALGTHGIEKLIREDVSEDVDEQRVTERLDRAPRGLDLPLVVHDLRNPISAIALEMDLMRENLNAGMFPQVGKAIARVLSNVEFIDRMMEDLLDSWTLGDGALVLHREHTDIRALVQRVIDRTVSARERSRITFDGIGTRWVSIDPLRIERVLANLLQNALKFAPAATPIVVRLKLLSDVTQIAVSDVGPGIASENSELVFERHWRAPGAHAHTGSGLGLYVSRQIIEAHGGSLGIESVQDRGACFTFELPVQ